MSFRTKSLFSVVVLSIFCLWIGQSQPLPSRYQTSRAPASKISLSTLQCLSDAFKNAQSWSKTALPRIENYHLYREKKALVSSEYTENPNFKNLIKDPDHDFEITHTSLLEAVSGIEAVKQGKLKGPIKRGPAGSEFIDGDNLLWDVKTPISPAQADSWHFKSEEVGHSIIEKIDGDPNMHILLDISYLTEKDLISLNNWMKDNLSQNQLDKIVSILIEKPFEVVQ